MQKQMKLIDLPDPEWIELLRAEVTKGNTITNVAHSIGMERCSLSLLLSGNYPAKLNKVSEKFAAKVLARYKNEVLCPHLRKGITATLCSTHAAAPMSISHPDRLAHWRACRSCRQNPHTTETKDAG